jgi:catechol 2,3-dioxygenase-like lactoylglutathione lyase family enzyme
VDATHFFAGLAVSDFRAACDWYERLFDCPPAFFPKEGEAVWHVASSASVYVTDDRTRAGNGLITVAVKNLDAQRDALARRDLPVEEDAERNGMRTLIATDADGNTIKFFEDPSRA